MAKTLVKLENVRVSFGLRQIIDVDSFSISDGDRIGLVGENGAGKTTLLRLIAGEIMPDSGQIARFSDVSLIRQLDERSWEFDTFDPKVEAEFDAQPVHEGLSGGERTRRRIAGALSGGCPLLLADEPTNDLDQEGIKLLTRNLKQHDGAILLISHDRQLLDELCNLIVELEDAHLTSYPGNYSAYRLEKQRRYEFQQFEYDQYRQEQARLKQVIQNKVEQAQQVHLPGRMGNSEARLHKRSVSASQASVHQVRGALSSRLNQLDEKQRPRDEPVIKMQLGAHTQITSRIAVEVRGLSLYAGAKQLLEQGDMRLPVKTRTALMGPNGCGKTTLVRRIVNGGDPRIRVSPGVNIGLFDQDHQESLDLDKTALENVLSGAVYPESDVRTMLARLNMRGDDVFKKVQTLSGGERAKVALGRLFCMDVNLLVLDEPTNHLDMFTLESLEAVLGSYGGTLLVVSHDRRFISAVATRLVMIENKRLVTFEGTMEAYENQGTGSAADESRQMDIMALEMRMAYLASKIPQAKRDDKRKKEAEYQELVEKLRELKA